jgi:rare lipoprotein A
MQGARRALGVAAALGAMLLAGCAETTLAVHTAKQLGRGDQGKPQGIYKVGDPYQINGVWYYPAEDYGYSETGIASYYGGESQGVNFHGRSTANGEVYDMNALTAAHQTLPMPSLVRVTNLENGRSVVLRVNDRGPFVRGRIIDVSRRSAQLLGFEGQGTARVRVEALAEESRTLKTALLRGTPGSETTQIAAAPRAAVASDALPPPPGARASSSVASAALPPPSATLPPATTAASTNPRSRGKVTEQPIARPAAPVIAQPAQTTAASAPPPVATRPRQTASAAPPAPTETAALPVTQQAAATAVVTQGSVQPTSLFIQAGAFANYDNAYRMSVRLSRYGGTKVTPVNAGAQQLYRVRLGPINSVQEADLLLAEVTPVVPEARIVVD